MKKPLVVDLDDTLSHHVEHLLEVYNAESGDNLKYSDITSWNISDFVMTEFKNRVNSYFSQPNWFRYLAPRKDAQEYLQRLSDTYNIYVASAYVPEACFDKAEWLKEHFPFINQRNIIFINDKGWLRFPCIIDDGLHNLVDFDKKIVMDRPWNRKSYEYQSNVSDKFCIRCKDWRDVAAVLPSVY